ncbi:MAG: hypothetical protein HWE25_10415 [Alphaproteobacteria bacterium]|nr:hypothetical protein [Alphaproteobacteria bacterium]
MALHDIDRFRGWALTALYGSMAILAVMLVFATYQFWASTGENSVGVFLLAGSGVAATLFSAITCTRFLGIMRNSDETPRLALLPFFLMAVTLFLASQVFVGA